MAACWQSLSALDHVLLYIAIPATLILLIQTVLLFAGGAFDSDGDAGVPDADGPDFDGHLVDYDDAMRRGVKEAVGTLIVEFGSYGKAPLVEPATLEDMAARYAKEG